MEKMLFQEYAPELRVQMLKETCRGTETLTYTRQLTEAEIEAEAKRLADLNADFFNTEEEKKQANKEFSDQLNSIREKMRNVSDTISKRSKEITAKCFKYVSPETGEVCFYDELGNLVRSRKAMREELSHDLFEQEREENAKHLIEQQDDAPRLLPPDDAEEAEHEEVNDDEE